MNSAYGIYPAVNVEGDADAAVPFIPHHLRYMMIEILKNAVRATVEFHRAKCTLPVFHQLLLVVIAMLLALANRYFPDLPPVMVQLVEGPKYVTVRVSDRGGGCSYSLSYHLLLIIVNFCFGILRRFEGCRRKYITRPLTTATRP